MDEQLELCARITDAGVVEDQQRAARSGYGRRMRSRDRWLLGRLEGARQCDDG